MHLSLTCKKNTFESVCVLDLQICWRWIICITRFTGIAVQRFRVSKNASVSRWLLSNETSRRVFFCACRRRTDARIWVARINMNGENSLRTSTPFNVSRILMHPRYGCSWFLHFGDRIQIFFGPDERSIFRYAHKRNIFWRLTKVYKIHVLAGIF